MVKNQNYLASIKQHALECVGLLNELSDKSQRRLLNETEYLAVQRLLQVLIESAIGVAKHWIQTLKVPVRAEAYANFQILYDRKIINDEELRNWKKIIGLRNVLVHDYLNVDPDIIRGILNHQFYRMVNEFIDKAFQEIPKLDNY